MVLKQGNTTIWGTSSKVKDRVILFINGSEIARTSVDSKHVWKLYFTSPTGHGPFQITAMSSQGNLTLSDVLFGDVWICSGQSNMEFEVSKVNVVRCI